MRNLNDWLLEYGESHQHPTNVGIHKVCVPLIMFSLLGLVWCIPQIELMQKYHYINFCSLFIIPCLVFYLILNIKVFVGMLITTVIMFAGIHLLDQVGTLLVISVSIFVLAWIVQIWGHKIEGKKPSFLKDLTFLLIGPIWVLNSLYKKIGVEI